MIQFSQEDSLGCTPREFRPTQSFSPARKKNRSRGFVPPPDNSQELAVNTFLMLSQESSSVSLSQDFADRLGHLNVQCSQDTAPDDCSIPFVDKFPPPAPRIMKSSKTGVGCADDEKQIDLRPVNRNPFLTPKSHHAEQYFARPDLHTGMKLPPKIWISAFKERPRYITDFEEVALLGEGTFSSVFCARHRLDGNLYAIKKIRMRIQSENHGRILTREVCAFTALTGCPNLVRYFSSWTEDNQLYMQLELCPLGSLEDLISRTPSRTSIMRTATVDFDVADMRKRSDSFASESENAHTLNRTTSFQLTMASPMDRPSSTPLAFVQKGIREELAWVVLHDVACCLQFMHSKGMVHLDIRPANVFMQAASHFLEPVEPSATGPGSLFQKVVNGRAGVKESPIKQEDSVRDKVEKRLIERSYLVKVGDLGHCRDASEKMLIEEGESRYCPRELINSDSDSLDLTKADVFSLGASVYELCLGRFLGGGGDDGMAEWHNIRDGELSVDFDYHYSSALTDFVRRLLHSDAAARPTALEVISHSAQKIATSNKRARECGSQNSQIAALLAENERLRVLLMSTAGKDAKLAKA